jgi:hypothetical protein
MRKSLFAAAAFAFLAIPAFAQRCDQYNTQDDGSAEGGWVVAIPAGSSDYFNVKYPISSKTPAGTLICGMSICVADFGASVSYPVVGKYNSNLGLDPSGCTPDLGSPLASVNNPAILGPPLFTWRCVDLIPFRTPVTPMHAVVQFPPGDPGLLGVCGDSDLNANGGGECPGTPVVHDTSGFTQDGYATPSIQFAGATWGLGCKVDCCDTVQRTGGPVLRFFTDPGGMCGDYCTVTRRAGDFTGLAFWGRLWRVNPPLCDTWLIFLSLFGVPLFPVGPALPSLACDSCNDADNVRDDCCSIRIGATLPTGVGGFTFNFVAFAACNGVAGTVGMTNEVTLKTLPDPNIQWGQYDDGSYETGWVVSIPSGSSDYFNVNFGSCPGITISSLDMAVMDFGTSATAYPRAGVSRENLVVDASGNTPDLGATYRDFPATFPAFTFVTTSGALLNYPFAPFSPTTANTHQFVQFPPGDPGLLGIGGDTNSAFISGLSGWSLDGYSTPANLVGYANWGMRLQ